MNATLDIAETIEGLIRETFVGVPIDSVHVAEGFDFEDDAVLQITVVFDKKGGLDPHKTVAMVRHIRDKLETTRDPIAFPILSFVSKSDAASLKPLDLIESASRLIEGKRQPAQVDLRRATSSAYYALFHGLARSCAELIVGGPGAQRSSGAWRQVYRALQHGQTKTAVTGGVEAEIFGGFAAPRSRWDGLWSPAVVLNDQSVAVGTTAGCGKLSSKIVKPPFRKPPNTSAS